jgi:UDP-N-acetylmuramate--alanine ligase
MRPRWPPTTWLHSDLDSPRAGVPVRRAYCVGMAGSGMQAIAEWLLAAGWQVSGSDRSATPILIEHFRALGARLDRQQDFISLPPCLDFLIHSPAIPETNAERVAAREQGVPEWSYPQALGQLMRGHLGISIAGTHGKSTTTALVGHLLRESGLDPSIICGARMLRENRSGTCGTGTLLVAESCEYRGHFLELSPRCIGLLGIEPDHFDCFPTFDQALATYRQFLSRLPPEGLIVANRDCAATTSIVNEMGTRTIFVSTTDEQADYLVTRVATSAAGLSLSVRMPNQEMIDLICPQSGNHHAINITTALVIALEHGASLDQCRAALANFAGIGRRFELRAEDRGVTWIDDYAHHPTAVKAVLDAARDRYPRRRIWCAFQPHQVSRTRELASDFAKALSRADEVLILPVFGAREAGDGEQIELSRQLVRDVAARGTPAHFASDLDHTWTTLETHLRPGDVVLTVGAGDIDRIYHEFTGRLRLHHAS